MKELKEVAEQIKFTNDLNKINECNVYIVTVPTPINTDNEPDLSALLSACQMISGHLKKNDLVIFNQLFSRAALRIFAERLWKSTPS